MDTLSSSKLTRYAWLSIGVAILTIGLKSAAYFLTGSVGLLSDALESLVNLAGALMALAMLTVAARPADEEHPFGHSKAEYFSSGLEGFLIVAAALSIIYTAVQRLITPKPLEQLGIGLIVSVAASLANLGAALIIRQAGRKNNSITLIANSNHLMTDVITSGGVIVGIGAVALTGWIVLDPIIAILVAINIIVTGYRIVRESVSGLMDSALSKEDLDLIEGILEQHKEKGVEYHALRTRKSGAKKMITMHVLVPGRWTVQRGHRLISQIEKEIKDKVSDSIVLTHLETLSDPESFEDDGFGQAAPPAPEK